MALKHLGFTVLLFTALVPACSDGAAGDPVASERESLATACVQNVLCIVGDHFDPVACKCVPNRPAQCVSGPGGRCGGFTQSPCVCAPGTRCVPNRIPDVPGVCAVCDPIPCPSGERWDRASCSCVGGCRTAADCHGALPDLCRLCPNGSAGCAHFECRAGACDVEYCQ